MTFNVVITTKRNVKEKRKLNKAIMIQWNASD